MHFFPQNATKRSVPPKVVVKEGNKYRIHKRDEQEKKMKEISMIMVMKSYKIRAIMSGYHQSRLKYKNKKF